MKKDLLSNVLACALIFCATSSLAQYAKDDSVQVNDFLARANALYDLDKVDSSVYYCLQARDLSQLTGYKRGLADFASTYVPILNRQGKYKEALEIAKQGIETCQQIGDKLMLSIAYNNAANVYQYLGDLKSAATHYLNALVFVENTNNLKHQQKYCNNLASVFLQMEDLDKSFHYSSKSYELAVRNRDSLGMASTLVNLSVNEIMSGKLDDAAKHLDEVAALGRALNDNSYVLDSYLSRADIEFRRLNYRASLRYYTKGLEVLKTYDAPDYELYFYWGLANTYHHMQSYQKANEYLEKSIALAKQLNVLDELRKIYPLASEINEKMNRLDVAIDYRKKYESLNDSLVSAETKENIHKLETEYRTAEKEKDLAEQKLTIANNEAEIQKKNTLILLSATIAVALLSATIIVLLVYRNKQRFHQEGLKLLEKQNEVRVLTATMEGQEQERTRLARELHDGVGGILSAAKMHLSIVSDNDQHLGDAMSMLNHASQEIRTIAHNLSPNIILMNELDTAVEEFCNRMKSERLVIDCYTIGKVPRLKPAFKLCVYRTVQEIITNVIRHAGASRVLVQMSISDNVLLLSIEDNGRGFDPAMNRGNGLMNLESRVKEMNGEMHIQSSPGSGTAVQLEFDTTAYLESPERSKTTAEIHLS
jgi:signal transduction histidine kinase